MSLKTIYLPYHTSGLTVYAFPVVAVDGTEYNFADYSTYREPATEVKPNLYKATVDSTDGNLWAFFSGASNPTSWDEALNEGLVDIADRTTLETIQAKTDLLGSEVLVTNSASPVTEEDEIDPIVIGDDYFASNDRDFKWTIPEISGFDPLECECHFGGKFDVDNTWNVAGEVSDLGDGTWKLSFDLPKTATQSLRADFYEWSVEVSSGGTEITRVRHAKKVRLVSKQT